ncbi:uncharacterized protein LOC119401626 [Rhipicephalus sanguineus]|uniref:uncharacterized protein LOC119401626 n=1 Tax=Rhipicephalus sanguineus TaxID=34632 RepID=UPI001894363C|nr:uncharacterized protein LOC119401626 [Rhipicephalus sanguineus]
MRSGLGLLSELEPTAKMTVLDSSCSALTKESPSAALTEAGAASGDAAGSRPDKQRHGSAGYFQQLFHAPNGNLFSVLSPLQQRSGRGCTMKPAFLCRQPAQQMGQRATRSRSGRRGGGSRCLKFHNFIPSESITSEKDDGSHDDVWKVHAECKLQEEHGTKQIMVSQWSVSSTDAPPSSSASSLVQAATESRHPAVNDATATAELDKSQSQLASRLRAEVTRRQPPSSTCPPPASSPTNKAADVSGPNTDEASPHPQQQGQVTNQTGLVVTAVTAPPVVDEEVLRATPGSFVPSRNSELFNELASSSCCSEDVQSRTESAPASPVGGVDTNADTSGKQSEILFECLSKRHRRKPSQTRRVVPYRKYLSLLENDEAPGVSHPLDLSMKTRARATADDTSSTVSSSGSCCLPPVVCGASSFVPCCLPACSSQPYLPSVPSEHYHFPYQDLRTSVPGCFEKSPLQVALEAPLTTPPSRRLFSAFSQPSGVALGHQSAVSVPTVPTTQLPFGYALYSAPSSSGAGVKPSHPLQPQSYTDCSGSGSRSALMAVLQNCRDPRTSSAHSASPSPSEAPRGLRKPSQRSLIKQKLEDTFKQNGFLVKTKQVSDGDATFCKFRQLRKYTRYYLKSWHHHLPAEVHKLWKGFLPPKTLPGPGGSGEDAPRDSSHGSLSLTQ